MPWGTIDDRFYDHDKVLGLPAEIRNDACGLYWRAISYCNAKLTDGFVAAAVVGHLDGRPEVVAALVAAKLWHRRRGGFLIHDFLDGYNRSRSDVEEGHRKKAEAGRLGGKRSGEARRKHQPSKAEAPASRVVGVRLNSESPSESPSESVETPPPPAERGPGRRANGTSPRAVGTSPRQTGDNLRANGESQRQEREAAKRAPVVPLAVAEPDDGLTEEEIERQARAFREQLAAGRSAP